MTTRLQTKSGANKFSLGWQRLQRCDKNVRKSGDESCILPLKTKPKISINTAIFCCETIFIRHEYLFHAILSKKKDFIVLSFSFENKIIFLSLQVKVSSVKRWHGKHRRLTDQTKSDTKTGRYRIFPLLNIWVSKIFELCINRGLALLRAVLQWISFFFLDGIKTIERNFVKWMGRSAWIRLYTQYQIRYTSREQFYHTILEAVIAMHGNTSTSLHERAVWDICFRVLCVLQCVLHFEPAFSYTACALFSLTSWRWSLKKKERNPFAELSRTSCGASKIVVESRVFAMGEI